MVREKLKERDPLALSILASVLGPIITTLMLGFIAYVKDFSSLPTDMKAVKATLEAVRMETVAEKMERKETDSVLARRLDMNDEAHGRIVEEHREIRARLR